MLPYNGPSLVSAGGDAKLHIWNWMTGALLEIIRVLDHAKPYMIVSLNKMRKEAHEWALVNKGPKQHPKKDTHGDLDQK
jgi:hypothetical protein